MRTIIINHTVRELMIQSFASEVPSTSHVDEIINEEACVIYKNKVIAIYKKETADLTEIRNACLMLKIDTYKRQSGLVTQTVNINASPRNGLRTNKCVFTKFNRQQPLTHRIFLLYARQIAKSYRKYFSSAYSNQIKQSYIGKRKVDEAYRIKGTPFTSGVINKDTALRYHRDIANTNDGMSCMLILKKGIAGGELILPELKIGFACQDGFILLFDGQKYIHGVTPLIKPQSGSGYRYTIVYYNNKGMALCLPPEDEEQHYKAYLEKLTERNHQKQIENER